MVSSLLRSLSGSIRGFPGTGAVGLPGPAQFDLALAAQAKFIICDQSIDEVFLTINSERHDLWQAVDQDDNVLDILVQRRRNKQAAKKFFRKRAGHGDTHVPASAEPTRSQHRGEAISGDGGVQGGGIHVPRCVHRHHANKVAATARPCAASVAGLDAKPRRCAMPRSSAVAAM